MAYYRRIRELREDNDKTHREIAEYLGTPYQYYSVYEKGGSEISFERAIALAKYYNVSLDYIAGLTDVKKNSAVNGIPNFEAELLERLDSLSEEERGKFSELLSLIIKMIK